MECIQRNGPEAPRHLVEFSSLEHDGGTSDVLVIGAGVAGLAAALSAARDGVSVRVLSKAALPETNTAYAQGGIAAVLGRDERSGGDSVERHVRDTLQAGGGFCDEEAVRSIVGGAGEAIAFLRGLGCRFDAGADGQVALTREGGHSQRRILHAAGDATGREIGRALLLAARSEDAIELREHCFVIDLLRHGGRVVGALACDDSGRLHLLRARQVILASGGCGQLWRETTNPQIATGDGLAMAYRAGATLCDCEFMQFHPTTLYIAGKPRYLITEAMRGEGAQLLGHGGERFMPRYHPEAELAPRDVVSQAILQEIATSGFPHVWLDATHLPADFVRTRFPTIYRTCQDLEIDITRDWIPVHPSAHYHCGGVLTDLDGRSSLPGLLAAGEVACTGLNGANRLASNSLLEGLVMGLRAGSWAAAHREPLFDERLRWTLAHKHHPVIDAADLTRSLRSLMWRHVGISRHAAGLDQAGRTLDFWTSHQGKGAFANTIGWEMQNMLLVGSLITLAARKRGCSIGTHLRSDSGGTVDARHRCLTRPEED